MASSSKTLILLTLLLFVSLSTSLDMSILSYEEELNSSLALKSESEVIQLFESWLVKHGKNYNALGEKERRFQNFKDNLHKIDRHNANKSKTFTLGINQFSDLTYQEFKSIYLSPKVDNVMSFKNTSTSDRYLHNVNDDLPASINWRLKGAVGPVKDQGAGCGSCAAHAAIATVEGINQIVTGKLITLSEQQVMDCTGIGCFPELGNDAFKYIIKNGGVNTNKDYPYVVPAEGYQVCDKDKEKKKVVSIDGYMLVKQNDEKALQKAVANQPIFVSVNWSEELMHYKAGVFTGNCSAGKLHAAAIVGYGTTLFDKLDFWLLKNSYGTEWGMDGYFKIERNTDTSRGKCGIAELPLYPTIRDPSAPPPPPPVVHCYDSAKTCPANSRCCCIGYFFKQCNSWVCCPLNIHCSDATSRTCQLKEDKSVIQYM